MGITNFYSWLRNKYGQCFHQINYSNITYEHIYFDVNYLLHYCFYNSKNEKHLIDKIYANLDFYLCMFNITKSITFGIDGIPSDAKILLQCKRRESYPEPKDPNFNQSMFSPGTDFMHRLVEYLEKYIQSRSYLYQYRQIEFTIHDSSQYGEAEMKYCNQLIKNHKKCLYDRHLIIGMDADIIVMLMSLYQINNINILMKQGFKYDILSLDDLTNELFNKYKINRTRLNVRLDFVLLSLLCGNDYFPKLGFTNIDKIWSAYEIIKKPIMYYSSINLESFSDFMLEIVKQLNKKYINIKSINFEQDLYKNYIDGLIWCYDMYMNCECKDFAFISYFKSINPLALLYYLYMCNISLTGIYNKIRKPCSKHDYECILLGHNDYDDNRKLFKKLDSKINC